MSERQTKRFMTRLDKVLAMSLAIMEQQQKSVSRSRKRPGKGSMAGSPSKRRHSSAGAEKVTHRITA